MHAPANVLLPDPLLPMTAIREGGAIDERARITMGYAA